MRGRGERGERERADVEEDAVAAVPSRAPFDSGHRDASGSAARGPKSAAPASAPTTLTEIEPGLVHLERQGLADTDEARSATGRHVGRRAEDRAGDARSDAQRRRRGDEQREPPGELEEARHRRPRCGRAPVSRRSTSGIPRRGSERRGAPSSTGGTRARGRVSAREQQGSVLALEHPVAALELGAVHREVGLVDELVRVGAVLREARRHPSRPSRGSARSTSRPRTGARRPRGGCVRRSRTPARAASREQDRELLAAEPCRHVVVAQLLRKTSATPLRTASPARWP